MLRARATSFVLLAVVVEEVAVTEDWVLEVRCGAADLTGDLVVAFVDTFAIEQIAGSAGLVVHRQLRELVVDVLEPVWVARLGGLTRGWGASQLVEYLGTADVVVALVFDKRVAGLVHLRKTTLAKL